MSSNRAIASRLIFGALITIFFFSNKAYSQTWSPIGSGGMDDWVYASTFYNGDLIVGGKFTSADGVSANHIARWDGSSWHPLGLGVNAKVWALIVHNGLLYVGGEFTEAGGIPMNFIAIWDGTQWSNDLGDMGSTVSSFAIYDNRLIVGGYFTDADGLPLNYIAQRTDTGWAGLGSGTVGTQGQIMAMEVYNNELIVGGFFTSAGGVPANHVAKWNGTTWSALGSGISNIVYSFTNYNGNLIAGGLFLGAGGLPANHIASWNGNSWSALGNGMSGTFYQYVFALTVYNGNLIAGGYFTHSDGVVTNGIAQWNGTGWSDMGCGLFYPGNVFGVHTLCLYGTDLIVGGLFNSAGCVGAAHLASYNNAAISTLSVSPDSLTIGASANSTQTFDIFSNISWMATSDQSWLTINSDTGSGNAAITLTATANVTASPRIATVTVSGSGVNSQAVTVTQFALTTGISEIKENEYILTPNPFSDKILLVLKNAILPASVSICDVTGKQVYVTRLNDFQNEINLSDLYNGMYLAKVINNNRNIKTIKIIKQ